jgi:hypothetical protein
MAPTLDAARETRPETSGHLWRWINAYTGIRVPHQAICRGHSAPFDPIARSWTDAPGMMLVHGPRGGGKSLGQGILTHAASRFAPNMGTRILGGSKAQAEQVYHAVRLTALDSTGPAGNDRGSLAELLKTEARYRNGSHVSILAASPTSVRGPHVPRLVLDEVDEIDPDVREASLGMCMSLNGYRAQVIMSSTWHRLEGPMSDLLEKGREGAFPTFSFCIFEVLERCPDERSGPNLERCPECPLKPWCHDEGIAEAGTPRAKRSNGHYSIDSLAQKVLATSVRVFESDYLCRGPRADGLWFPTFSRATHVGVEAEYKPGHPVYLAVDCGSSRYTGGVLFQVLEWNDGQIWVNVFADYIGVDVVSEQNARTLLELSRIRCNGRLDRVRLDPASGARTSLGPAAYGEYERIFGSRLIAPWPLRSVRDSLELLDAFVRPAAGPPKLRIHPRCETTIRALECFRRAKRAGRWIDEPEREDHPHEDMVDALKGGLCDVFPEGRRPQPKLTRVPARIMI